MNRKIKYIGGIQPGYVPNGVSCAADLITVDFGGAIGQIGALGWNWVSPPIAAAEKKIPLLNQEHEKIFRKAINNLQEKLEEISDTGLQNENFKTKFVGKEIHGKRNYSVVSIQEKLNTDTNKTTYNILFVADTNQLDIPAYEIRHLDSEEELRELIKIVLVELS